MKTNNKTINKTNSKLDSKTINKTNSKNKFNINRVVICCIIVLAVVVIALFFIPAKEKVNVTVCHSTIDQSKSGYTIKTDYKISSVKKAVKKVEIVNNIKSSNKTVLNYFEKQYKGMYEEQNKRYGGYTITTEKKENSVVVKVIIDYSKVKLAKLAEDNPNIADSIKNDKLSLDGAKSIYNSLGATCE
ncbi:MAG: hypothetical protein IKN63_06690 [Bacilli bacterium]|nr:hypothetical protein [Bacilli bacterium]